ncbi:hypothetical protein [Mycolicibacterium neoaurum]|uniref:hypothetical protein n=1 Tax=Mycolicibacterium neoaurum TaxID=1795 RepID=UPI001F4CF6D3|nr:hypothetical protein [Mycolicibacterium neoaurum]
MQVIETAQMRGLPGRATVGAECREYVYASTSWEVAAAFSVLNGGRAVCEVNPGLLGAEADPDFPTLGVRFHGPVKAASVQVIDTADLPNARQIVQALAADYRWEDCRPQYAEDGYLTVPPTSRERGYVDEDFRWLGRWFPFHFLFPYDDWSEVALDENGQRHVIYPPGHPDLGGRRRLPYGSLEQAWRRPGFYPDSHDHLRASFKRAPVLMPWDW